MRLELHVKGIEATQRLRDYIETKLQLALGRFSHRVQDVQVRLVDVNGPKGGEDIQCHVLANLGSAGVLKIEETRVNPFQAVAHASKRVRHSLSRRLSRRRSNRRERREESM